MVAADGGILCDEATKRSAERGLTFSGRRALTVKGWSEPISVDRPAEQVLGGPLHDGGTIIGRETEQRHLKACLEALISGTGGLVLVRGEAGIGKSRLLADVLEHARQCGIRGLTSTGSAIEVATPYFPWRRILAQLLSGRALPPGMRPCGTGAPVRGRRGIAGVDSAAERRASTANAGEQHHRANRGRRSSLEHSRAVDGLIAARGCSAADGVGCR